MVLSKLKVGEKAIIVKIMGSGSYRKRMMELGLVQGEEVKVLKIAPFGDIGEFLVMGSHLVIRKLDTDLIEVVPISELSQSVMPNKQSVSENTDLRGEITKTTTINVAILGLPNSGKTSLFNALTGLNERVANYSGVTLSAKEFVIPFEGYQITITDLPGINSLCNVVESEEIAKNHIVNQTPDLILNVVDGSNLERNLYLTTEIIDMDIPMVIAITMFDELEKSGRKLELEELSRLLGCPIIPIVTKHQSSAKELLEALISVYNDDNKFSRHIHVHYGDLIEEGIKSIQKLIREDVSSSLGNKVSPRYLSVKLLEGDIETQKEVSQLINERLIFAEVEKFHDRIEKEYGDTVDSVITRLKFGFIKGAVYETIKEPLLPKNESNRSFDRFLTHKILGFPIFAGLIWLMFFATFKLGAYPMSWIEQGVQWFGNWIASNMADSMLKDLMVDGVISGMGGVLVFFAKYFASFSFYCHHGRNRVHVASSFYSR